MRVIKENDIINAVRDMCIEANKIIPASLENLINESPDKEDNELGKAILCDICKNLTAAREMDIPICQDTGMAVVFLEVGQDIHLVGGDLGAAIETGVRRAYVDGKLRLSVVDDPIYGRKNTGTNTPAVVHTEIVPGDRVKITVIPKGFGSENMSAVRMFNPSAVEDDIVAFVTETVKKAGANPCPPVTIGVGIGGTFEKAALLSKKALARELDDRNPDEKYAKLEEKMLNEINKLDIGPQGFGGNTTALSVKIEKYPTHIAGLPVAVNVCCHVHRHASAYV